MSYSNPILRHRPDKNRSEKQVLLQVPDERVWHAISDSKQFVTGLELISTDRSPPGIG
jgi:hypothetical protein